MLLNLIYEYVDAINTGGVPQILTSLERVISAELRKISDDLLIEYHEKSGEFWEMDKMPFDEEEIRGLHRDLVSTIMNKFDLRSKEIGELAEVSDIRTELSDKIEKNYSEILLQNEQSSQESCKKLINEILNSFPLPLVLKWDDVQIGFIKDRKADFMRFFDVYKKCARGPHKYDLYSECMPSFLFDFFAKYIDNVKTLHDEEINDVKVFLAQAREGEERLRNRLNDQQEAINRMEQQKDFWKLELEKAEKEMNSTLRKKTNDEQYLAEQNKELEEKLAAKKLKIKNLKKDKKELEDSMVTLKKERKDMLTQNSLFNHKVLDLEKELVVYRTKTYETGQESPEVAKQLTVIQNQIEYIRQSIASKDPANKRSDLGEQLIEKENEISQLKLNYTEELTKAKEDYKKKIQTYKDRYQLATEDFNKRFEMVKNENSKLKAQIVDYKTNHDSIQKKEKIIENLYEEKRRLTESVNFVNQKYDTNQRVIEEVFSRDIERKTNRIEELDFERAMINSQITELKSKFDGLHDATRESIKRAAGKNHNLKHSLKTLEEMDKDSAQRIRDYFRDINNPVSY
jgi:chromosome segregation ATPase